MKTLVTTAMILIATTLASSNSLAGSSVPTGEVPTHIVNMLARGDLNKAILEMRDSVPCLKIDYLMRLVSGIVLFDMEKKPSRSKAHMIYQNVAIAHHNLYLFLKTQGIEQTEYYDEANRYYKKARSSGTYLHKSECDLLRAALLATGGDTEKARKKFAKIDELMLRGDFESMEYLAAYYAAVGDIEKAINALAAAYDMEPDKTLEWLNISDDFESLKGDPEYIAMVDSWRARCKSRELTLTIPRCEEPRLDMIGSDPYRPFGYSAKAKRQLKRNRNKR